MADLEQFSFALRVWQARQQPFRTSQDCRIWSPKGPHQSLRDSFSTGEATIPAALSMSLPLRGRWRNAPDEVHLATRSSHPAPKDSQMYIFAVVSLTDDF